MSKHTPLPWNIDHVKPWPNCPGVHDFKIKDKNGRGLARIEALPDWKEMESNAAIVVEAVNNYAALRAELDAVKKTLEKIHVEANNILYLDDNSDYATSLWQIMKWANPDNDAEYSDELNWIDRAQEASE